MCGENHNEELDSPALKTVSSRHLITGNAATRKRKKKAEVSEKFHRFLDC